MGPAKSIEEVQQILRELGMTQAICIPVFEGMMEPHGLQGCPKHLVLNSVLAEPGCGTDMYDVGVAGIYYWSGAGGN